MTTPPPGHGAAAAAIARAVVAGVRHALPEHAVLFDASATEFVAALVTSRRPDEPLGTFTGAAAFRRAGVAEHEVGGDVDRLARAYQTAGRHALPVIAELGRRSDAGAVGTGVEAVLRCVDVLIRLSTEAYRAAQAPDVPALRRDLLHAITTGRPWTGLAARAGWTPPERVVAVVVAAGTEAPRFGPEVLADLTAEHPFLLLPATADLSRVLGQEPAAAGPAVPPSEAGTSLRWARRTWELHKRGLVPGAGLVRWSEHLTTHWLIADELLTGVLATRALAPLSGLSPNQRGKLADTLDAVLAARGGAPEIAARLGIHPQTARNRLRRLRALFGARLEVPEERLTLRIALRARRVLDPEAVR
ncbi:helix-turn-helix domain-containing protein [Amycolatopsis sp. NPDC101161]|uniref:PucR family transcriptional regulator n=1 Tax=Amycolatopsis sp. NPDC101161 TaxID=3363940 RepID=UPI00382C3833